MKVSDDFVRYSQGALSLNMYTVIMDNSML